MALNRHRDQDGTEERKRNDTLVRTLRQIYGERFAPEFRADMTLGTLKGKLGLAQTASLDEVLSRYGIRTH